MKMFNKWKYSTLTFFRDSRLLDFIVLRRSENIQQLKIIDAEFFLRLAASGFYRFEEKWKCSTFENSRRFIFLKICGFWILSFWGEVKMFNIWKSSTLNIFFRLAATGIECFSPCVKSLMLVPGRLLSIIPRGTFIFFKILPMSYYHRENMDLLSEYSMGKKNNSETVGHGFELISLGNCAREYGEVS